MNETRFARRAALSALLLLTLGAYPAHAQLNLTLDNPVQAGLPGSTLSYTLTLLNAGAGTISLDGIATGLSHPDLSVDLTPFFVNFPATLTAGQSVTAVGFELLISAGAAPSGPHADFLTVSWSDAGVPDTVAQPFSATISGAGGAAAPEPGALSLSLLGLIGVGLRRRRR